MVSRTLSVGRDFEISVLVICGFFRGVFEG